MKTHPFAKICRDMTEEEFRAHKEDVRENGQREAIVVLDDAILDGRNRWRACKELGIEPRTVRYRGPTDDAALLRFVVSENIRRRHLSESERAASIASAEEVVLRVLKEAGERKRAHGGTAPGRKSLRADVPEVSRPRDQLAAIANVSPRLMQEALSLRKENPEALQNAKDGKKTLTAAVREQKEAAREKRRAGNRVLAEKTDDVAAAGARFATIVADPPWDWGDEGEGAGGGQFGRAKPDYATMPIEQLMELPIERLADKDAHLYLWITNRSLPKGFALLERWGFRYVTCLTWCKPSIGMGNYFRGSTEHVLFGVRGSQPLLKKNVGTWFQAPRGKAHSSKPDEFFSIVESCSPGPYLELFARKPRRGWKVWGAEA